MDLSYGEEAEALRREVRAFVEQHRAQAPLGAIGLGGRPDERVRRWQALLIERGYAARNVPREYGGFGAPVDPLARIVIDEEFARAGISRGIGGQGPDMLVPTLLEHGTEEQRRQYVGPTIRGEMVWCQGYSEPEAGSDLANVRTSAVVEGDEFVVTGHKIWTTSAHFSDMMFCLVRTEPERPRHAGLSYLLLPMAAAGISVQPLMTMTGKAEFNQVFFDGVRVPRANIVGERGEGWRIANATLVHERNMLGSAAQIDAFFQALLRLARTETRDGRPLIEDPLVRDRLMRLQAEVFAARWHSSRLLSTRLRGEPVGVAGLVVKLTGCELAHQIATTALELLGEIGTLSERSPHERAGGFWAFQQMFSLGLIIGGGTAQIQKNIISERGLGLPRETRGDV